MVGPKGPKEKYTSKEGYWAFTDCTFADIDPALVRPFFSYRLALLVPQVKALVVPGGLLCPDRLRRYEECLSLVQKAKEAGAVLGFICHGPWVGISAKVLRGVKATCFFAIKDDLINAGADYSADKVVVDQQHRMCAPLLNRAPLPH